KNLETSRRDLDLPRRQVRVLRARLPLLDRAADRDAVLALHALGVRTHIRMDDHLNRAARVAEVEEDDLPVVAAVMNPSGQSDFAPRIRSAQLAAGMGSHHCARSPSHEVAASKATSLCSPDVMSRMVTAPDESSFSPIKAANRAPVRSACFSCVFNPRST